MVSTKKSIDYEQVQSINFTLRAYDIGEPQLSSAAHVIVDIININDVNPVFDKVRYLFKIPIFFYHVRRITFDKNFIHILARIFCRH